MRRSLIVVAAAVALVCASTALAGGWATVRLSLSPKGMSADKPWVVDITVLQHGLASQPLSRSEANRDDSQGRAAPLHHERGAREVADFQGPERRVALGSTALASCSRTPACGATRSLTPSPCTAEHARIRSRR